MGFKAWDLGFRVWDLGVRSLVPNSLRVKSEVGTLGHYYGHLTLGSLLYPYCMPYTTLPAEIPGCC